MKKIIIAFFVILCGFFYIINKNIFEKNSAGFTSLITVSKNEDQCFNKSYSQISDSMLVAWDSKFKEIGIEQNPFAIIIFFIKYFSELDCEDAQGYFSLNEIFFNKISNLKSNTIATCAIMQKLGWDIQYFYNNKRERYLGINFSETWNIRKGNWVENDEKKYYLKEYDDYTPVGKLKLENPASTYYSLGTKKIVLKPIPLINNLPGFSSTSYKKRLIWSYKDRRYEITASIPEEQVKWTGNLPPSLFGMIASGIRELENIRIVGKLKFLLDEFDEYDKVNFLFKFCQSESIFIYDNKQSIKSVSNQLMEGLNDCDGRSVFLYCLLQAVLGYSDSDIVFISWHNHLALGLKPETAEAGKILRQDGFYAGDGYYILDAAYVGDTYWGSKMNRFPDECKIITK